MLQCILVKEFSPNVVQLDTSLWEQYSINQLTIIDSCIWPSVRLLHHFTALQSCLYNDSLASDANHDSGFTPAVNDRPSLRELRLVAMHMERWEAIGKDLGIDQATLEQCRKSHR